MQSVRGCTSMRGLGVAPCAVRHTRACATYRGQRAARGAHREQHQQCDAAGASALVPQQTTHPGRQGLRILRRCGPVDAERLDQLHGVAVRRLSLCHGAQQRRRLLQAQPETFKEVQGSACCMICTISRNAARMSSIKSSIKHTCSICTMASAVCALRQLNRCMQRIEAIVKDVHICRR